MRKTHVLFFFGSIGILAFAPRCSSGSSDCTQTSTCPSEASEGPPPLVCDMTQDPKSAPGCLDDRVGVFVSPSGSDSNPGTKAAPFQTLGKALASVGSLTRVYVCSGTYAEDVSIATPVDGVSIYGGFSCADWSYTGDKPTIGKGQIALTVSGTTKPFTIEDVAFVAAAGATGSPSSIAALVANASGLVTFTRVSLTAGAGANGTDGAAGANYDANLSSSDAKIKGHDASGAAGGTLQTCGGLCTDNVTSSGGSGGQGTTSPGDGSDGTPNLGGGLGGKVSGTCTGGNGGNATTPGADATSPTTLGTLGDKGWTPTSSSVGKDGAPGQGGGGGAGQSQSGDGGGGGGACGGCGGGGGGGGAGGGGSIALAVFSSVVSVNASDLVAGNGGKGGTGSAGQVGQTGGAHGNGSGFGCSGGNGGTGSAGGTGAGGVGGISVGVLYKGNAPTVDAATTNTVGTAGAAGAGGTAGTNDGIAGVAMPTMASP